MKLKYILLLLISGFFCAITKSQDRGGVVFSEDTIKNPSESAILEMVSTKKGFLLPRIDNYSDLTDSIKSPTDGLLVFVENPSDKYGLWYYSDGCKCWENLIVWGSETKSDIAPAGGIIMYHGDMSNFDDTGLGTKGTELDGWALCNGKNGTPDLRGKFIVGGDKSSNRPEYRSIGPDSKNLGKSSYKVDINTMPKHNHTFKDTVINISITHSHEFEFQSQTDDIFDDAGHKHKYNTNFKGSFKRGELSFRGRPKNENRLKYVETDSKTTGISLQSSPLQIDCTISEEGLDNNKASGLAIDNRPKYYVLAYIIRIDDPSKQNFKGKFIVNY